MDMIRQLRMEKRDAAVAFFSGWKLWQQMCFVLAILIVLTLSAGLGRVWYNARRIRKYSRVATNAAQSPSELEAQRASTGSKMEKLVRVDGYQVPFGIRALEDGIEVEGVWVSQPNTPVPDSPASVASSHSGSYNSSRCLNKPEPLRPLESIHLSDDILEQPQAPWARRSFVGPSNHQSDGPTLTGARPSPTPWQHGRRQQCMIKTQSYPAARPATLLMHNPAALNSLEGNPRCSVDITESVTQSEHYSPTSTEDSDDDLEKFELIHPAFRPTRRDRPVAADPRGDLNLLHSHRLSHVAETGELKPRTRRLASDDQWVAGAENAESPSEYSSHGGSGTSTPQAGVLGERSNPFATPRTSRSSSLSLQLASLDDTQHELATPPTSEMVTPLAMSDAADTSRGVPSPVMLHDPIESYYNRLQKMRQQHRDSWSPNEWGPQVPQTVLTGQNHERLSQVLRKVNSQFEILRPGTLNALEEKQRMAELQNQQSQQSQRQRDKRTHRKLRKKRLSQGSAFFVDMGYT